MRDRTSLLLLTLCLSLLVGCGPDRREQTLSTINIEAARWQGGPDFETTAVDAYGNALSAKVEKGPINHVLEIRSNGPDGLPLNSDDIIVSSKARHGESSLKQEAKKAVESLSSGATKGAIDGIKEGLGFGKDKEPAEDVEPKE